jgi:Nuclease-related domain
VTLDMPTLLLVLGACALMLLLWKLVYTRRSSEPRRRFRKSSTAFLADFLIPDGEGGEIHIENALLCMRGIIVVNIKEVVGNVFGSDTMQEWAVITGDNRYTFGNPQDGLYDRTAAVKRITPDVPVIGYIAFTDTAEFSKGFPKHVVGLSPLLDDLEKEYSEQNAAPDAFYPSWEKLVAAATVTHVDQLANDS